MYAFAGYEDVQRPGVSVEESAVLLRRWGYVEFQLVRMLGGRMTSTPEMEVKYAQGRHAFEDAVHARELQTRLGDLRNHWSVMEPGQDTDLSVLLDETLRAPDSAAFLAAVYGVWKPALIAAYRAYLERQNSLADSLTDHALRHILVDEEMQVAWGREAFEAVLAEAEEPAAARAAADAFAQEIAGLLDCIGGLDGAAPKDVGIERRRSAAPFAPKVVPERDRRYVQICEFPRELEPTETPMVRMMRRRMNEIDVAELCATTLYEVEGKPLAYYVDLARHCFDECRHAMFGHAGLVGEGHDPTRFALKRGNARFFQEEEPMDRYIHLGVVIEQKKMKKTGKKAEWLWCRDEARHPLMTTFQDFDWADEVAHVQMSRRWVKEFFDQDWEQVEARAKQIEERWAQAVDLWDKEKAAC
jgi:hypothetical protein